MKGMAMNLQKKWLWVAISLGILSGPALAVPVDCTITPVNSIITEGQTLQLQADCDGALDAINWQMDGTTVTGDVGLTGHVAHQPLYYTTPVGLGGDNTFDFTMTGTPAGANTWGSSTTAKVVVKPSSAVVAKAAGSTTPTTPVNAAMRCREQHRSDQHALKRPAVLVGHTGLGHQRADVLHLVVHQLERRP